MKNSVKYLILITFAIGTGAILIYNPAPHERILNIQNYLITVGGIISGFMMAYLASKIFNLRNERRKVQNEIDSYADKLTDFRRVLYYVLRSREFWIHYDDIQRFQQEYKDLTYIDLHDLGLSKNEGEKKKL